MVKVDMKSRMR